MKVTNQFYKLKTFISKDPNELTQEVEHYLNGLLKSYGYIDVDHNFSVIDLGGRTCQYGDLVSVYIEEWEKEDSDNDIVKSTDILVDLGIAKSGVKKTVTKTTKPAVKKGRPAKKEVFGKAVTPDNAVNDNVIAVDSNPLNVKGLFDEVPTLRAKGGIFPDRDIPGVS